MTQPRIDLNALWKYVIEQVKGQISLPSLWRAMEAGRPLTLEEDQLILGYAANEMHQSGLLLSSQNLNVIEQVLHQATRKRLRIRVISGETLADWEMAKQHEVEAARLQQETRDQYRRKVTTGATWDAVGEQLVDRFRSLPNRGLPSVQGRFLAESLELVAEAYGRLMPEEPTETDERAYSRVLDRLAERVLVPSPIIATLIHERVRGGGDD